MNKKVHIIGGGTVSYVRSHLALTAPAYGQTARRLADMCETQSNKLDVFLHLTRMAGGEKGLETVEDVSNRIDKLVEDPSTKIIFMNAAMCDFRGNVVEEEVRHSDWTDELQGYSATRLSEILTESSKTAPRLTSKVDHYLKLTPYDKVISKIRKHRKDIFLVGFKHTNGLPAQEQYILGLNLLKASSCNLVLANDMTTRMNMVITPEEAKYHMTHDREASLRGLVEMAYLRSHLTFTRSTIVAGDSIPWDSDLVPASLRTVVDYCIEQGAYKPFRGSTVGHFAVKVNDTTFLTSKRKTNFNELKDIGLVKVVTDGPDSVIAYGSKPSVGGQSQRIVFHDHQDYDCIVHFHSPILPNSKVPIVSQREIECGSHECGKNTSNNLKKFGNLSAVYLDEHGPNIVFNRSIDPQEVINFINENFDLSRKTGGYVSLQQIVDTPDTLQELMKLHD